MGSVNDNYQPWIKGSFNGAKSQFTLYSLWNFMRTPLQFTAVTGFSSVKTKGSNKINLEVDVVFHFSLPITTVCISRQKYDTGPGTWQ